MRLADRLFAFGRRPSWSDPVQVLLWILGWAIVAGFVFQVATLAPAWLDGTAQGSDGERGVFGVILLIALVAILGWSVVGSWFVSEAYRGWRSGHPHGRQWTILIAGILLMGVFGLGMAWQRSDAPQAAFFAVEVGFGLALLVAGLATRPPTGQVASAT